MATISTPYEKPPRRFPPFWIGVAIFVALLVAFIAIFDWNWLRGPLARYYSHKTGRDVHISHLDVHPWSFQPRVTIDDLTISNPDWAPKGDTASIPKLSVTMKLLPLFIGRLILPRVVVDQPEFALLRDDKGRATWEFGANAKEDVQPLKLPPIRNFLIRDGHVTIEDKTRDLHFTGTISSEENATEGRTAFELIGDGTLNRNPFSMNVIGGPLINIDRSKPYEFDMKVRAGATRVAAKGAIDHPFDLGGLTADVTFRGANLADLYYLTGIVLPHTPPYRFSAKFTRNDAIYTLTGINGTVGNSDLQGDLKIDVTSGRPYLKGDLASRSVNFVDLGALFGGGPTGTKLQQAAAKAGIAPAEAQAETRQTQYFLPHVPLEVDRVRQMDADVTYHADKVVSETFPLRRLDLTLKLDHGVLTLDPVAMALSQGEVSGSVGIDARKDVPAVDVDLRFRDINLQQFVPATNGQSPIEGVLEARAKLHGTGKSVHKAAGTANGTLTAVVPKGAVRKQFVELLGIDVDQALFLSGSDDQTNVRCAVADFSAKDGTLSARHIVFDTESVNVNGNGTINLGDETLNMTVQGAPKSIRLVRVRAPITITGSLSNPSVGIKPAGAIAQAGAAVGLSVLLTPLAAILPFVDPGLAKDANCAGLVSEAKAKGAPVHHKDLH
jgi:uncharacterized protein involved in outer membrane biogenesis